MLNALGNISCDKVKVKIKGQIMYFLVNSSPLDIVASNTAAA